MTTKQINELLFEAYSRPDERAWELADKVWLMPQGLTPRDQNIWKSQWSLRGRIDRLEIHLNGGQVRLPLLMPVRRAKMEVAA